MPAAQRAGLDPFLAECARLAPGFAWVPARNLHLTLRFLGPLGEAELESLSRGLAAIGRPAFDVRLGRLGVFGGRRRARVVWLGLAAGGEASSEVAAAVEAACRESGLAPDDGRFRPHVTLARARPRGGEPLRPLPEPPDQEGWRADRLVLFESRLGRPAAVYEPVREFDLE